MQKYKTSEWVSLGHSDKMADYISEYILDRLIEQDPKTRYALEVQIKDYDVMLGGEITTNAKHINYGQLVKEAINEIGYTKAYSKRFGDGNTICGDEMTITTHINRQSPDIAKGVDESGWGDQGIFFGYYCDESDEGHGYDYYMAKKIGKALYNHALKSKTLGLDIKTQVTALVDEMGVLSVEEVIVAIPMVSGKEKEGTKEVKEILNSVCPKNVPFIINGTGSYCKHGPVADSGTTGRKLVVDFYGGNSRIGGGSPWTKDGTKADLTLNIYANELAREYFIECKDMGMPVARVETELSSCIGKAQVLIQTTAYDSEGVVIFRDSAIRRIKPETLIKRYKLNTPIFAQLCRDGLFSIFKQNKKENAQ